MKRFFVFIIFLIVAFACDNISSNKESNSAIQDSIQLYIQNAHNFELPENEVIQSLNKAQDLIKTLPRDSVYFKNKIYVAFIYDNIGKKQEFKNTVLELIDEAIQAKDSFYLARAYTYLGEYYSDNVVMDSAVINFQQAEKIYFGIKDNIGIGRMHVKMATAKHKVRDYLGSEKSAVLALTYIRLENNKLLEYEAYNILGITCLDIKDYEKAKEYFQKAYRIASEEQLVNFGSYQTMAVSLNNLGWINLKTSNYREALSYFNQAIQEPDLLQEYPGLYATILDNKAKAKLRLGDFSDLPNDFYQSLKIREELQLVPEIVNSRINLSEYYEKKGVLDSAKYFAQEAYKMAKQTNIINLQLSAIDQLNNVEPENQSLYSKEYVKLTDSLFQGERQVSEKFARIEYETDEFKRQKEQLAVQNRNIILFALLAVFIVVLLYIIRDQRSRNKFFRLREEQQKANEEIYSLMLSQQKKLDEVVIKEKQRIGQELHDGVLGRLFGARLNLDSLNKKGDELAIAGRDHYISELKFIEQDIREISHELSREKFALINNFVAILTNLFEEQKNLSENTDFKYTIDQAIKWDKVDNDLKINIYRIIQESLQNINKYAKAKNVSVNLLKDADNLHVSILDDGIGFEVSKKSKGIGLQNISSRVSTCKGTFEIKSKPGNGTTITIDLPFKK
ncbi:MAG TPA: ATP-binding protein [Flavobacterium sp.]|uniref:tetratricopeptide repeat-containing sensor histidine kinase n=2 Tax=Flavobacterium TaxID=237 RepID=UPI0025BE252B|nr:MULTISPECIES: ATP-binding protein [unclassified Flavobacterium]HRE76463.1 ATP-binding protein [Flavobacterium sp.]